MPLPNAYSPKGLEDKWYQHWSDSNYFSSKPSEKEPFTVVIPPPNVTGVLHMGHLLNNTIIDVLVRKARLEGKNACWVPGTDHASIATEAKVVAQLKANGIDKNKISRSDFLNYAWEWTDKYGGIILQQLKKMGASCDWSRTAFTMDESRYNSVIKVFRDLHEKGLIYKGQKMINWDPEAQTALSDEEVKHKEVNSKLYHVKYALENGPDITIATTRPETILGDTAICVHPEDDRYRKYIGLRAFVPIVNRKIPIIADEYVDPEFGTGALKITPAHDPNDFELGEKHELESVDIFNADGTIKEGVGHFEGLDRFVVRKDLVKALEKRGVLAKVEEITNKVGFSERTDAVVEPRISSQWFCKMKDLARPALEQVLEDKIQFFPTKFVNTYRHWMENIKDWCVSRQLWWGHRIPVFYLPNGEYVVATSPEEALDLAKAKMPDIKAEDLRQEEDVLDTWFSSWLWPMSVFNGILEPENEEFKYYYPTNVLVTGPDIIFFWVARMIMAGDAFAQNVPFEKVYFTGMVRDDQGRKMSKSLGNSPDLLKMIDDYGADAVRFGAMISSPAGNDLLFDVKLCDQGRNFCNKMWNALRLINSWEDLGKIEENARMSSHQEAAFELFEAKMAEVMQLMTTNYERFRISDVLKGLYNLVWNDFCANLLEWIKPSKEEQISAEAFQKVKALYGKMMQMLHPFMPFITEEIWQHLKKDTDGDIVVSAYPEQPTSGDQELKAYEKLAQLQAMVRNFKTEVNIPLSKKIAIEVVSEDADFYQKYDALISRAAQLSAVEISSGAPDGKEVRMLQTDQICFDTSGLVDAGEQKRKMEEELAYYQGFLSKVEKKLNNAGFVNNAKAEVVEKERQKQADTKAKIAHLENNLKRLTDK